MFMGVFPCLMLLQLFFFQISCEILFSVQEKGGSKKSPLHPLQVSTQSNNKEQSDLGPYCLQ